MGALISSTWVKADSGTWPPFGKMDVDATGPPPNTLFEPVEDDLAEAEVEEERLALAAVSELDGPNSGLAADPPATRTVEPPELVAPVAAVRIYRWRRSMG